MFPAGVTGYAHNAVPGTFVSTQHLAAIVGAIVIIAEAGDTNGSWECRWSWKELEVWPCDQTAHTHGPEIRNRAPLGPGLLPLLITLSLLPVF